ncbi:hypothetical protein M0812_12469 [Anaeramoeba flamelloides]|uniref:Regulator of chromosome condensation n=1 Tax=Anaeramoeba flamelloides TaxID=1746091 RepID=A0AAV7ZL53_9EUKA|nr:hypothetical protein M0812_12469 [Anaeramoeba flamelloides]
MQTYHPLNQKTYVQGWINGILPKPKGNYCREAKFNRFNHLPAIHRFASTAVDYQSGLSNRNSSKLPRFHKKDIDQVFCSKSSDSIFYSKFGQLYAYGSNYYGQLGIDKTSNHKVNLYFLKHNNDEILDLISKDHSLILTKKNKLYSCGKSDLIRRRGNKNSFKLIPTLKNKQIIQISLSFNKSIAITSRNEIYVWGRKRKCISFQVSLWPRKIIIPNNKITPDDYGVKSYLLHNVTVIYKPINTSIAKDFENCYYNQRFCDSEFNIFEGYKKGLLNLKCHKKFVEFRTKKTLKKIKNVICYYKVEEIYKFLKWIYTGAFAHSDKNQKAIFTELELKFPPEISVQETLQVMYFDNKSKDFEIVFQKPDEERQNDKWLVIENTMEIKKKIDEKLSYTSQTKNLNIIEKDDFLRIEYCSEKISNKKENGQEKEKGKGKSLILDNDEKEKEDNKEEEEEVDDDDNDDEEEEENSQKNKKILKNDNNKLLKNKKKENDQANEKKNPSGKKGNNDKSKSN